LLRVCLTFYSRDSRPGGPDFPLLPFSPLCCLFFEVTSLKGIFRSLAGVARILFSLHLPFVLRFCSLCCEPVRFLLPYFSPFHPCFPTGSRWFFSFSPNGHPGSTFVDGVPRLVGVLLVNAVLLGSSPLPHVLSIVPSILHFFVPPPFA